LKQRIDILDSLRGIAASIVVFHHVHAQFNAFFPTPSTRIGSLLNTLSGFNVAAVLFFFLISGFSIALSVAGNWGWTNKDINHYIYRRFRRIVPLYLIALVLTALCGIPGGLIYTNSAYGLTTLAGNLFFLQCSDAYAGNWFLPYGGNGPLWTLSFELWFYLFLPATLLMLRQFLPQKWQQLPLLHAGFLAAWICSIGCIWFNKQFFLPWIAFGTLFVVWYAGFWIGSVYLRKTMTIQHLIFLAAGTAFHILLSTRVRSSNLAYLSYAGVIACFFMMGCMIPKYFKAVFSIVQKVINTLFRRIGESSYALYLFHFPLLEISRRNFPSSETALILTLAITLVISVIAEDWFRHKKLLFFKRNYMPSLQA
jgi:peptidoglycan/LPS O-acetylase OafA/YrhL